MDELARTGTSRVTPKELLERAVADLPLDATVEEAVDALYVALKVGKGIAEIHEGRGYSQEEVEKSVERWLA
jgi:predicted transcriptional regulator